MTKQSKSLNFRRKKIYETRNYLFKEIKDNEFMNKRHKKVYIILNSFIVFLIFISTCIGYVSIPAFTLLVVVLVGITSSVVGLKIYTVITGIQKYKLIVKKNKNNHDHIVLLAKTKLNTIKLLISKTVRDSNINHDEFVSENNVLRKYNEMKEEIKNP